MKRLMIAMAALANLTGAALAQDAGAGEASFRKCQPCYDLGPQAPNKISGPKLNGLDGRKAGTVDGFDYTEVNKNSGIVRSHDTLPRCRAPR